MRRGQRAGNTAIWRRYGGETAPWRSRVQEGEHRQDAAVILHRGGEAELVEDAGHVLLDGPLADDELVGDRLVRAALRHQRQDLSLARRQLGQGVVTPAPPQQVGHDLSVEGRSALAHPAHRLDEAVDVRYTVLEQ